MLKPQSKRLPHAVRHNSTDVCILGRHSVNVTTSFAQQSGFQQGKLTKKAVHRSTYHTTQRQIVRAPTSASCAAAASPAAALFAAASAEAVDCSSPCGRRRVKSRPLAAVGNLSRPLRFHRAVPVANRRLWALQCPPVTPRPRRTQLREIRAAFASRRSQHASSLPLLPLRSGS